VFRKFLRKIQEAAQAARQSELDRIPEIADPLVQEVQWTPQASGGANFRTHRLVLVNPNRLQYRPTFGAILFGGLFLLFGGGAVALGLHGLLSQAEHIDWGLLFPVGIGAIFILVGLFLALHFCKPITFDLDTGYFWKGRRNPALLLPAEQDTFGTKLKDVHALQLIRERCTSKNSSYYSYELNLVLHDGSRVNVIDHGKLDAIRDEARRIADLLGVDVWDAA
jgi:hypothetical protein